MRALARRLLLRLAPGQPLALWVLLLLLALHATAAQATQRALLVGVSELANQPQALWLAAPRNDVLLMRQVLQQRGFAPAEITVLADGVAGAPLPDSRQIRDAFSRLLARSQSGDFVLLYFSGHGTRVRDPGKAYAEPDGLAENFLARDARLAPGANMPLAGGLRDVDFDGWIRAFMAKGVFVWSVFDTCSATSMTRGAPRTRSAAAASAGEANDDEVRFRGIRADELARGVDAPDAADAAPLAAIAPPPQPAVPRSRYVAFFASESHQVTPELRLPRGERAARPQGLLTWALAQALGGPSASFRELFNQVVSLYPPVIDELAARYPQRELPSPVAEGNLDLPLFAAPVAAQSTRPAWPARRTGAQLALAVGQLDGLQPQQPVRVVATLADGTQRSGLALLDDVQLATAGMAVPPALAGQEGATLWTVSPVDEPASVALSVQLAPGTALPAGLNLEYPAAIRVVGAGADADVRIAGRAQPTLEVLSPALAALGESGKPYALADGAALRQQLLSLAQLKWLARLNQLAQGGQLEGFEATLETWAGNQLLRSMPAASVASSSASGGAGALPAPAEGERIALLVRNATGHSLDLVVLGMQADGAIRQVYPQAMSETNRFERGTREQPAQQRFELPWLQAPRGGRLMVVAAPAAPFSAPRLFGAAAPQPPSAFADVRTRGASPGEGRGARQVYSALLTWAGPGR